MKTIYAPLLLVLVALTGCTDQGPTVPVTQSSSATTAAVSAATSTTTRSTDGDESTDSTIASTDSTDASGTGSAVEDGTFVAPDGGVEQGYTLSFDVIGGGARIANLTAEVLETCDGDSRTTTVGPDLEWEIIDGSFSGRQKEVVEGVSVYTTLEGRFTSPTTAEGTVRQETVVAGSVCDTYALDFTAEAR